MMAVMKTIKHTMRYENVSADQVFEMLATPAFREEVCEAQKVLSSKVEQTRDGDRLSSRVEQVQNTEGVPAFAKKIVGDKTTVIQAEEWSSPTSATLTVTIPGKPGTIDGTVEISESGGGVDELVTVNLTRRDPPGRCQDREHPRGAAHQGDAQGERDREAVAGSR